MQSVLQYNPNLNKVIKSTTVSSGNLEVIDSGMVLSYDPTQSIEIREKFNDTFTITICFIFEMDESEKQDLQIKSDPATNTIRYFCRNFNNPLGTGTSTPIEIGSIEYKKMFINFWITAIGGKNMRTRKLEYTIWKEK